MSDVPPDQRLFLNYKTRIAGGYPMRRRYIRNGAAVYSYGCYLFSVRECEVRLDKWRFSNFSKEALPYEAKLEAVPSYELSERLLPWLRYETEQWSIEVPLGTNPLTELSNGRLSSIGAKPLILTFSNPKDAWFIRFYGDQVVSGEKRTKRRTRRKLVLVD